MPVREGVRSEGKPRSKAVPQAPVQQFPSAEILRIQVASSVPVVTVAPEKAKSGEYAGFAVDRPN